MVTIIHCCHIDDVDRGIGIYRSFDWSRAILVLKR